MADIRSLLERELIETLGGMPSQPMAPPARVPDPVEPLDFSSFGAPVDAIPAPAAAPAPAPVPALDIPLPERKPQAGIPMPDLNPQRVPAIESGLPPLTGEQAGTTPAGRPRIRDEQGGISTERSITEFVDGAWRNLPSMFGGKEVSPREAIEIMRQNNWVDPETGEKFWTQTYPTLEEAEAAAKHRSDVDLRDVGAGHPPSVAPKPSPLSGTLDFSDMGEPVEPGVIDSIVDTVTDPWQAVEAAKAVPGGAVEGVGLAVQGAAGMNPADPVARDIQKFADEIANVPNMTPEQKADLRTRISKETGGFVTPFVLKAVTDVESGLLTPEQFLEQYRAPLPMSERSAFKAGEAIREASKDILPAAPGYEDSVGRQLGHGLGTLVGGLPAAFVNPALGGAFFIGMGVGESAARAEEFDKAEKAAGRPGLTEEQKTLVAILGVAPGATDVIPVENLLGRLPVGRLIPQPFRRPLAQAIARIGGQAFLEGIQEGGQGFLQNLIAQEYDASQGLTEGILPEAGLGAGVGAIAQAFKELLPGRERGADTGPGLEVEPPKQLPPPAIRMPDDRTPVQRQIDDLDLSDLGEAIEPGTDAGAEAPQPTDVSRETEVDPGDVELLRTAGYSDDDIAVMAPEERVEAVAEARAQGVEVPTSTAEGPSEDREGATEAPEAPSETPEGASPAAEAVSSDPDLGEFGAREGTKAKPVAVESAEDIARAGEVASTDYSPEQGEANNIQRAHVNWEGIDGTIEVAAGGKRRGTNPKTGEPWETTHTVPYGYWKKTRGGDGMEVDVYWGPEPKADHPVYIIDEVDGETGKFRQHKTFAGFPSEEAAREAYLGTSTKKPEHIGGIAAMPVDEFKTWLRGDTTKPVTKRPDERKLREYAGTVVSDDIQSVNLVGSVADKGAGADIDLLYDLGARDLPPDPGEAAAAVTDIVERSNIDIDSYDAFFKVGDRYFHASSGAGREIVENTDYAAEQADRPVVPLAQREAAAEPPAAEDIDLTIPEFLRRPKGESPEVPLGGARAQEVTPEPEKTVEQEMEEARPAFDEYLAGNKHLKSLQFGIKAPRGVTQRLLDEAVADGRLIKVKSKNPKTFPYRRKPKDYEERVARMKQMAEDRRKAKAAEKGEVAPETETATETTVEAEPQDQPVKGEIGMKLAAGQVVLTATGRETTPFPKIDTSSERKANNTIKRVDEWLMQNAADEAKSRGDDFSQRQFEADLKNPPPASKEFAEYYLFDEDFIQEPQKSILKPLSGAETTESAETASEAAGTSTPEPETETVDDTDAVEVPAGDSDEDVTMRLTPKGPWDFNDTYPAPDPKQKAALIQEGRWQFEHDDGPELTREVAATFDESLNEMQVLFSERQALGDQRKAALDDPKAKPPKKKMSREDWLAQLEKAIRDKNRDIRAIVSVYTDIFGTDAAAAMRREAASREGTRPDATAEMTSAGAEAALETEGEAQVDLPEGGKWPHETMPADEIFPTPAKTLRAADMAGGTKYIPLEQAETRVEEWKAIAKWIGENYDNSDKAILSLFDATGSWSKPFDDAGFEVVRYDVTQAKQSDDYHPGDEKIFDLIQRFPSGDIAEIKDSGMDVYGVLSACPCTTFAGSGARWWKELHDKKDRAAIEKVFGEWVPENFESPLEVNQTLVHVTEAVIELANPSGFHVLENPVGRIARVTDLPAPLLRFDPNHYGDPYTKKTQLWGDFNAELPTANVEPTEGSKMHKLRGDKPEEKAARSITPEGFAYAFFIANAPKEQVAAARKALADEEPAGETEQRETAAEEGDEPADFSGTDEDIRAAIAFHTERQGGAVEFLRSRVKADSTVKEVNDLLADSRAWGQFMGASFSSVTGIRKTENRGATLTIWTVQNGQRKDVVLKGKVLADHIKALYAPEEEAGDGAATESEKPVETSARKRTKKKPDVQTIEDAGEKIGGARKDMWAGGITVADMADMTGAEIEKNITKQKVFPAPDYAALVEQGGLEPITAALMRQVYNALPAKPSTAGPSKRSNIDPKAYVAGLRAFRDYLATIKEGPAEPTSKWNMSSREWQDGFKEFLESRSSEDLDYFLPDDLVSAISKPKGRYSLIQPGYISPRDRSKADADVKTGWPVEQAPWQRLYLIEDDTTYDRDSNKWVPTGKFVLKRRTRGALDDTPEGERWGSRTYDTREEAVARAEELTAELNKQRRSDEGELPKRPHLDSVERTGPDYRNGRDVTGQDFVDDFGFRGVEFGNWVAGDERQKVVNLGYDALHDLARVLGLPPKSISLNGTMALGFGSRGKGGRAAAHYEPGRLVINMTKLSGAGSLAHEWGHALDHYLGEHTLDQPYAGAVRSISGWRDRWDNYGMYEARSKIGHLPERLQHTAVQLMAALHTRKETRAEHAERLQKELKNARIQVGRWKDALESWKQASAQGRYRGTKEIDRHEDGLAHWQRKFDAIKNLLEGKHFSGDRKTTKTNFFQNGAKLSGKTGEDGYWARPNELLARAFEAYVFDKLEQDGHTSQYLVQGVEADRYAGENYKGNPYPVGSERKTINMAFDRLITALQVTDGKLGPKTKLEARKGVVEPGDTITDVVDDGEPDLEAVKATLEAEMQALDEESKRIDERTKAKQNKRAREYKLNEILAHIQKHMPDVTLKGDELERAVDLYETGLDIDEVIERLAIEDVSTVEDEVIIDAVQEAIDDANADLGGEPSPDIGRLARAGETGEDTVSDGPGVPDQSQTVREPGETGRPDEDLTEQDDAERSGLRKDAPEVSGDGAPGGLQGDEGERGADGSRREGGPAGASDVRGDGSPDDGPDQQAEPGLSAEGEGAGADPARRGGDRSPRGGVQPVADFDAALDAALDETFGTRSERAETKPRSADNRTTRQVARSAGSNITEGADAALTALTTLFGGPKVGSGPSFDEETYARARPHFIKAAESFGEAGADISEIVRRMVGELHRSYGWTRAMVENARPYLKRFIEEVVSGSITVDADAAAEVVEDAVIEAEETRQEHTPTNYHLTEEDEIGRGSPRDKIRRNISAIAVLKQIEEENREAADTEKRFLARYAGWGAFAQDVFIDNKPGWADERAGLRELLTREEYEAARASTLNAHYTSPDVIKGMWEAMEHLGFTGGRALEPAAGVGHFIGFQPKKDTKRTQWSAVELDNITGRIAKTLYSASDVNVQGFETFTRPDGYYDIAISNVPFGSYKITDPDRSGYLIHDYFFVKSLDLVRPGGVIAFITSSGTMDKAGDAARKEINRKAELLGAIRLPGGKDGAFTSNAGTEVTTDIIFLRRRVEGEPDRSQKWMRTKEIESVDGPVHVNEYFAANPQMMLGQMRLVGTMYREKSPVLIGDSDNLRARIADVARENLPEKAISPRGAGATLEQDESLDAAPVDGIKEGSFYVKDGAILQKRRGVGMKPRKMPKAFEPKAKLLIRLRDTMNELLRNQMQGRAESNDKLRKELSTLYDRFVKRYGPIGLTKISVSSRTNKAGDPIVTRRLPNFSAFKDDPDAYKVLGLENYDEQTGTAKKAALFDRDILAADVTPQIASEADALAVSLNQYGEVNLPAIADMLGISVPEALERLGDQVYSDPETPGRFVTAEEYLSGDVVGKLEEALKALEVDAGFQRNVDALQKVQPDPLTSLDIRAQMGAPWIPKDVYEQFLNEEIGGNSIKLGLNPLNNGWRIIGGYFDQAARTRWGTNDVSADKIIEASFNMQPIRVTKEVIENGNRKDVVDEQATEEARVKVADLRRIFTGDPITNDGGWAWADETRARRLETIYNKRYNRLVPRDYDASHLTFPGLTKTIAHSDGTIVPFTLRDHQRNAVWRIVSSGNTLLAHVVGSGKTFTMIASGMEQKRLGLVRRPMYVVPNHMLEQFSREFLQAYPGANILVAEKEHMSKANRELFAARVAAEEWDGIIITHDAFGRLPVSQEYEAEFIRTEIAEMEDAIREAKAEDGKSITVKNMEAAKRRREAKLQELLNRKRKDTGITFEELGVDFLYVDEAHLFKNLSFVTKMTRVKGLAQGEAQRAMGLFLKIRQLEERTRGRSAVFATGTPISNTIAEMYTMQRYLQHDRLREYGINGFDAWASTFGEVVTQMELSPDGRTFRETSAFSRFVNIPELVSLYSEVADTRTAEMLNLPRPDLAGGAPKVVEATPSPQEDAYIASLVHRAERVRGARAEKGGDNMLKIVSEGRKVATDMRLIDADAELNPTGKTALLLDEVYRRWKDAQDPALAQMIFLDMGTPKSGPAKVKVGEDITMIAHDIGTDGSFVEADRESADVFVSRFNLYQDIRARLIAKGIPKEQIAFIHEATDDVKKARMFERVRSGDIRVIIGSTSKMGMGTNVQDRLVAMHHMDAPWKPAEVEQRDGRILRQGNLNKEIEILRYVTKRSFDAFMWQTLERKAKFIGQLMAGARGVRVAEDIDDPLPEAATLKAAASGDPRIMEHAEISKKVRDLEAEKRTHDRSRLRAAREVERETGVLEQQREILAKAEKDVLQVVDLSGDNFKIELPADLGGPQTKRKDAGEKIAAFLNEEGKRTWGSQDHVRRAGTLSGFQVEFELVRDREGRVVARPRLVGALNYRGHEFEVHAEMDPGGVVRRLENILDNVGGNHRRTKANIAKLEEQIPRLEAQAAVGDFPKDAELLGAQRRLNELTKALSEKKPGQQQAASDAAPDDEVLESATVTSRDAPLLRQVGDVTTTFPDQHHAALYDLGRRIRAGQTPNRDEMQALFQRFEGYVTTDPDSGVTFNDLVDLGVVAIEYYDRAQEEARLRPKDFEAGDVIEVERRDDWWKRIIEEERGRKPQLRLDGAEAKKLADGINDALEIVRRVAGPDIAVEFHETIPSNRNAGGRDELVNMARSQGMRMAETSGGFYRRNRVIPARNLIGLALNDPLYDLRTTAGHEAFHHVERALMTDAERAVLTREMPRIKRYAAPEIGYAEDSPALDLLPNHEAVAIAFQRWRREREEGSPRGGLHIALRRVFERINQFLRQVAGVLRGQGYSSFEQIFERARQGEFASRQPRMVEPKLYESSQPEVVSTGPDGRTSRFDADLEQWQRQVRRLLSGQPLDRAQRFGREFFVLTALRLSSRGLSLSPQIASEVRSRHPDIPDAVWMRLPELVADPLYVYSRDDGIVNVVTAATTANGEPIAVGLRDGDIRTITPRHDKDGEPGADRERRIVAGARARGHTIYVRDERALRDLQSILGNDPRTRVPEHPSRRGRAGKIVTRDDVIKSQSRIFYSDAAVEAAPGSEAIPQTETDAFRRWFGDSAVVDENGDPLVVYHGTDARFEVFEQSEGGKATGAYSGKQGFFFSDRSRTARYYADQGGATKHKQKLAEINIALYESLAETWEGQGDHERARHWRDAAEQEKRFGPQVMQLYLSIKNPFVYDFKGKVYREDSYADLLQKAKALGHDGAIIKNTYDAGEYNRFDAVMRGRFRPETIYVAFEPNQIKSATGNSGAFDPEAESILESAIPRAEGTDAPVLSTLGALEERVRATLAKAGPVTDAARVKVQDKVLYLRRIQEAIEAETGTRLPVNLDTYVAEAIYHGRAGERLIDLQEVVVEPITEAMQDAEISPQQLGDYLYARHARERNRAILQIDPENEAGSGMTDAEADSIIGRIEKGGKLEAYERIAGIVDEMQAETRRQLYKAGLIDGETLKSWSKKYDHYVPLRGFEAGDPFAEVERARSGKGFDVRGPEARQALGRRSRADNPLVYAVLQAQQAIIRAEKNRVGKTLLRAVNQHPNDDIWKVYKGEYKRRLNPGTGLVEKFWLPPAFVNRDNLFAVKIGGETKWIELKDARLARAMRNAGSEVEGTIIGRGLLATARVYARLQTQWNPEFVISNMARDLETALINVSGEEDLPKGARKQILKDAASLKSIRGILSALRGDGSHDYAQWFEEYRLAGGKISFIDTNDVERIRRRIQTSIGSGKARTALRKTAELVEDINTSVENGVRLSAYIAMRKAGINQDRAAFVARELTVNFNRKGEWGPAINAAYIFFNASAQGSVRIAQALKRSKKVRYGVASIFALGLAIDMLNWLMAPDDEDGENTYDKLMRNQPWLFERNFILMNPFGNGDYLKLPLAYGYNAPYLAGQQLMAVIRGEKKPLEAAGTVTLALVEAFNPMGSAPTITQFLSPTLTDPMIQEAENRNWFGGRIKPTKYDDREPDSQSYFKSAPEWAVKLAEVLNEATGGNVGRPGYIDISPETIEHYVDFVTGGAGRFVLNAIQTGERLITGEEWLPEKMPFARRVYGAPSSVSRRREFYEAWDEVDAAYYEVRQLRKARETDAARAARKRNAAELGVHEIFKATKERLKDIRERRDRLNEDETLPRSKLREQLEKLQQRENAAILRALRDYNQARERVQ